MVAIIEKNQKAELSNSKKPTYGLVHKGEFKVERKSNPAVDIENVTKSKFTLKIVKMPK